MSSYNSDGYILYSTVSRGSKIFADMTSPKVESGNFAKITSRILDKIPLENGKMSYTYDAYVFNYEVFNEFIFLCLTDENFSRAQSFAFLSDISTKWMEKHKNLSKEDKIAMQPDKQFKAVLKERMHFFNTDPNANKIKKLKNQIDEVKETMIKNIDKVIERGEKIDILVTKTDAMKESSQMFRKNTRTLNHTVIFRNICIIVAIVIVLICFIAIILLFFCRGIQCLLSSAK